MNFFLKTLLCTIYKWNYYNSMKQFVRIKMNELSSQVNVSRFQVSTMTKKSFS